MSISPCPEPWELKLFALGTMSAEAAQRINDHLNECNACVAVLASEAETRRGAFPFPFLEPPVEPDEIGRLGEYRILRLLQSGGMGMVFHAEDIALRRSVALKILKPELEAANTASKRFLREAQLLAAIKHEHVVTIFDAGQVGPVVYLAMELLEGQSLADFLKSARPLSVPEILRLGREIAAGLAAIHRQGLIHRDIKPANIWLEAPGADPDQAGVTRESLGRVKILDLGLARPIQDDANLTHPGMIVGTPAFMSPEQAKGCPLDVRSDLFSLGAVLYTLCTGTPPFHRENTLAQLTALAASDVRPVRECNPAIPANLAELVVRLLAKDPAERPASAREVMVRLQEMETPANAAAQSGAWGDTRRLPEFPSKPSRSGGPTRWRKRAGVLLAFVLIGVGVFALLYWGVFGPPQGPETRGASLVSPAARLPETFTNSLGMEFVLVPRGKFWMWGGGGKPGDREMEIPHDFYLGKYEVTQEEWEKVLGAGRNPSQFSRTGTRQEDVKDIPDADLKRFPVDSVSWDDCQIFIATLNEQVKETGWVYRLPKEAEWEYACRGGPLPNKDDYGFDFYAGNPTNTLAPDSANFEGTGLKRTAKVGFSRPNRLGLFDMHGNVFELCDDLLFDDAGGPLRALRGGAWLDPARFCRAGRRGVGEPSHRNTGGGLRLARVPAGKESRAEK